MRGQKRTEESTEHEVINGDSRDELKTTDIDVQIKKRKFDNSNLYLLINNSHGFDSRRDCAKSAECKISAVKTFIKNFVCSMN